VGGVEVKKPIELLENYFAQLQEEGVYMYAAEVTRTAKVLAIAQQLSRIADALEKQVKEND
jgi:predicted RNA-binding protein with EMAP domain